MLQLHFLVPTPTLLFLGNGGSQLAFIIIWKATWMQSSKEGARTAGNAKQRTKISK